ncbi:MAG: hypothetical protein RL662_2313 [Bacteroidota bacterium]|jgi:hypothetical protein
MRKKILVLLSGCFLLATNTITAQVGIGTQTPNAASVLDVVSADKGVLFPRVTLTSNTDKTTVKVDATTNGMLVYNTGANPAFQIEGYLYWSGSEWRKITDNSALSIAPVIDELVGANVRLVPSTYQSGVPFPKGGVLEVAYTGGNGGSYGAGPILPAVNGLSLQLQAGTLQYGSGVITYSVTGTPTVSSPTTTTFNIEFLTKLTSVTVGTANAKVETRSYLGPMVPTIETAADGFGDGAHFAVTTLDGKYSLRFFSRNTYDLQYTDIQIRRNSTGSTNLMIMRRYTWTQILLDGTTDYNNQSSAGQSWNNYTLKDSWETIGDPDVYYLGAPELNEFVFSSTDQLDKKVYRYTMFFGAPDTNYSSYPNTKCWIMAEEITTE